MHGCLRKRHPTHDAQHLSLAQDDLQMALYPVQLIERAMGTHQHLHRSRVVSLTDGAVLRRAEDDPQCAVFRG